MTKEERTTVVVDVLGNAFVGLDDLIAAGNTPGRSPRLGVSSFGAVSALGDAHQRGDNETDDENQDVRHRRASHLIG
jgi:hypothetical protein